MKEVMTGVYYTLQIQIHNLMVNTTSSQTPVNQTGLPKKRNSRNPVTVTKSTV